ncbi:uncharacterized protein J7T54_007299 [Emericellopsis cladophorae]|uniref:Uncharacterized protein n=1 Tax=Emericellopsis cladophorae TaxID=2686198 RepID=A0A9P9XZZ8_9HYPO|nr:uncharacterized protein J7T54_007299 [Emericellopsis cladophorae]KAI6780820.1 hypothetical protein J7T54_007299 [Emericellopsis cladophorae]
MASLLPSYAEATTRPDWVPVIAPYVDFPDYHSLCLVSRRFWAIFAPRLWRDLLISVRRAGVDPSDDAHDFASDETERTIGRSLEKALEGLPNVETVLLDGHETLHPRLLQSVSHNGRLKVLSVVEMPFKLIPSESAYETFKNLVYLDISGIPGPVVVQQESNFLQRAHQPHLRILKIRGREADQAALKLLLRGFGRQLWSLDVSHNRIADDAVEDALCAHIPTGSLRASASSRADAEGGVAPFAAYSSTYDTNLNAGADGYGAFYTIEESHKSADFSHPESYFGDAPTYPPSAQDSRDYGEAPPVYSQTLDALGDAAVLQRADGLQVPKLDTADAASAILQQDANTIENYLSSEGLTHVSLSNTSVTGSGVERLMRLAQGHIEYLAHDSMPLLRPRIDSSRLWPSGGSLRGILGGAYVFRPVFSSNLRSLRIHHSLVTHIPDLEHENFSARASMYLVENLILPRIDTLFPQAFVPDMNPRLTSLTLTCVPRRSSGPLVARLVAFLKLLSIQERNIQCMAACCSSSLRGPGMLKGLRHLRLEFAPDPMEEDVSLEENDEGFSFFDNTWATAGTERSGSGNVHSSADRSDSGDSVRNDEDHIIHEWDWHPQSSAGPKRHTLSFKDKVWMGKKPSGLGEAIDTYRRLVLEQGLREGLGPATPGQIKAGVPAGALIFQTAWTLAVMPPSLPAPPVAALAGQQDVLSALKRYRLDGRRRYADARQRDGAAVRLGAPHFFWTGQLEVSIDL